ncbi:MAG: ATP-binding protein [Bacteroidia bacterium]|nr:ATP-binding protein [Bacteroidia bacterium]
MENQKYPIGLQSFAKIREGDYLYIDKTQGIYELITEKGYVFLSRPRRFGKSLLISTIKAIFEGRKELFGGLYIADKTDFIPHPVIHLSFDALNYKEKGLADVVINELSDIASTHQLTLEPDKLKDYFRNLIRELHEKTGQKVVILIDEYDHPILHYLEKGEYDKADEIRETIREFYSVIKSLDNHIRFFFVTGISRFAKVSLFSVLNNVVDITFDLQYSTICGYTQTELEWYFVEKITEIGIEHDLNYEECVERIKVWYNGYSWDGRKRVYAPFSTLLFMAQKEFKNHWFATGTPTLLIKLLSANVQYNLENIWVTEDVFDVFDIRNLDPVSLMFQTGYLTVKARREERYQLDYPNREVRDSFLRFLGGEYAHQRPYQINNWVRDFMEVLQNKEIEKIRELTDDLFSGIPYELFRGNQENFYHAIIFIALKLVGIHIQSEVSHSKGRIDAVIQTKDSVFIFEYKVNANAETALEQVKSRNYHQPFLHSGKKIYLFGINFSNENRGIQDWVWEEITG